MWHWLVFDWPLIAIIAAFVAIGTAVARAPWWRTGVAGRNECHDKDMDNGCAIAEDISTTETGRWLATFLLWRRALSVLESVDGIRLLSVVGGAAILVAAGFFLDHAIAQSWLTPILRLCLMGAVGIGFVFSGHFVDRRRKSDARDLLLPQSFIGIGVAICFGTVYAAHGIYDMISELAAFAAMVSVTIAAYGLALRHGWPIAVLGMTGASIVPILVPVLGRDNLSLYVYLTLLLVGSQMLSAYRRWETVHYLSGAAAIFWAISGLTGLYNSGQGNGIALAEIVVVFAAVTSWSTLGPVFRSDHDDEFVTLLRNGLQLSMGLFFVFISAATLYADEGRWISVVGYSFVALLTVRQGIRNTLGLPLTYLAALSGIAAMVSGAASIDIDVAARTAIIASVIVVAAAFVLPRARFPEAWAPLIAGVSLLTWTALYMRFSGLERDLNWALALATVSMGLAFYLRFVSSRLPEDRRVVTTAILASGVSIGIGASLFVGLTGLWLTIALATQTLVFLWIWRLTRASMWLWVAVAMAGFILARLTADPLLRTADLGFVETIIQIAVHFATAAMFAAASFFLWRSQLLIARIFAAFALADVMIFVHVRSLILVLDAVEGSQAGQSFVQVGMHVLLLGIVGWLLTILRKLPFGNLQPTLSTAMLGLWAAITVIIAGIAVLFAPTILYVQGLIFWNVNLVMFGLPTLLGCAIIKWSAASWSPAKRGAASIAIATGALSWMSFETVRTVLVLFPGDTPVNALTITWVAYAIGMLCWGLSRKLAVVRFISFFVLILTAAKLFFIDIAVGDSLARAATFFGFGATLLIIGLLYSRYVFRREEEVVAD